MSEIVFYKETGFHRLARGTNGTLKIVLLADENTRRECYPLVKPHLPAHHLICIPPGEEYKNLQTCAHIWSELTCLQADRQTVLYNLGGGVIGDMGGFAASCYKRGIRFANIPTTLLAMVDASVGGKTGIDFEGYKNQVGTFNEPGAVFIYPVFLKTLPERELHSGFAEVIKHYLIADKEAFTLLSSPIRLADADWEPIIRKNIGIKQSFVERDPKDSGLRKALNFGHTIGHAVESYFLQTPDKKLLHGEAVATGMIAESFISKQLGKLSAGELEFICRIILQYFNLPAIPPAATSEILELMKQDKKNAGGRFQFTLLEGIGNFSINNAVEESLVSDALDFYNAQLR